jgi:hypothetical protein
MQVEDEAMVQLPASTRLDNAGFTMKEKIALARQIQPAAWLDLLLFDLKDLPVFENQVRADDFLPFEIAWSAGDSASFGSSFGGWSATDYRSAGGRSEHESHQ